MRHKSFIQFSFNPSTVSVSAYKTTALPMSTTNQNLKNNNDLGYVSSKRKEVWRNEIVTPEFFAVLKEEIQNLQFVFQFNFELNIYIFSSLNVCYKRS